MVAFDVQRVLTEVEPTFDGSRLMVTEREPHDVPDFVDVHVESHALKEQRRRLRGVGPSRVQ